MQVLSRYGINLFLFNFKQIAVQTQIGKVIPEEGQIFIFEEFRFQIISRRKNRLALIQITPPLQIEENFPET